MNWKDKLYANRDIIGINPELEVYGGYDQREWGASLTGDDSTIGGNPLTDNEKYELANEMIRRWMAYRSAISQEHTP